MTEFEIVKQNGVKFEATCLSLSRRMTIEEASQFVLGLDSMESGMNWWVGDFLIAMEALHGEAYTQIIPESKSHTWPNYMWVSSRVKPNVRRPTLSWTHHQAIASLLSERQAIYLQRAETEKLSVSELKRLVKAEKGKSPKDSKLREYECPSCGFRFSLVEVNDALTKGPGEPTS